MQYYTVLSVLAGAAAVSAGGITDGLLAGAGLTGAADAKGDAKASLAGLPTDDILGSGLTGESEDVPEPLIDTADVANGPKDAKRDSLLEGLGLKQLYKPAGYPSEDPDRNTVDPPVVTSTVTDDLDVPTGTPTFVTRTVTDDLDVPTGTPTFVTRTVTDDLDVPTGTPTFVTRTVTDDRDVPTVTIRPPPIVTVRPPPVVTVRPPPVVTVRPPPTVTVRPPPTVTVPSNNETPTEAAGVTSCSEGTATSCCDTKAASDGLLSNILGGSCALSNLQIPVLAVGALGGSQCNDGNTFCCPINQNGNLNIALACIPLNL